MTIRGVLLIIGMLILQAAPAAPPDHTTLPIPAEVKVPASQRLQFTSAINGKSYTLALQIPSFSPPPPNGYPVIYVLDGDQYFGTASEINLSTGGQLAVVVAISYGLIDNPALVAQVLGRKADDAAPVTVSDMGRANKLLRDDDLFLPISPENRAPQWQMPVKTGGLDTFLSVLEREIKPRVAQMAPIDVSRQTIFGHSAGGLAVLRALFTEPTAFRTFVASSPAIWWNGRAVLADQAKFDEAVRAGRIAPRVLITVGEREEPKNPRILTPYQKSFLASLPPDRRAEVIAYKTNKLDAWGGMVSNARLLGRHLHSLKGGPDYKAEFVLFADEDHESVPPAALSRGMRFAR